MANQGERPRKRVIRLVGKRPKVAQRTPPATINGVALLPRRSATINGSAVLNG